MSIGARLASKSVIIFALRILGAGLIFVIQAAIARVWGAGALGDFVLITAATSLLAVVLPLGFQTVGTYFTSEYRARGEGRLLRRFLGFSYGHVLGVGVLVVLFGYPATHLMGAAGDLLRLYWWPITVAGVFYGVIFVNSTTLIGMKRPFSAYLVDMIARPVVMLGAFVLAAATGEGIRMAPMLWMLTAGLALLATLHFVITVGAVKRVPVQTPPRPMEHRRWWRFAAPWVLITVAADYFFDINLILLAGLMENTDLAIFGVATRIFALSSFGIVAVYALTLPSLFDADRDDDSLAFGRRVGEANLVATGLALALFLGVAVLGRYVLMIFGPEFSEGAVPAAILCLGLVVRAAFGPASLVLSMHDRPWESLPSVALGLAALVIGNQVLVPDHGLMGASVSAFIAITLWSAALWFTTLRRTGVDVSLFARLRPVPT